MKTNLIKLLTIAVFALTAAALMNLNPNTTTRVFAKDDDPAAVYKTKCAMCHSPKAEKLYDPAVAIEEQVNVILKGKKGEKPPYMPGFEAKGMTAEQAKALAEYMKQLRTPAN
ncbi:MAG TPA: cytochrome c [Pyrinomonadaceae bacterium]|jgi:mono/diheme cytochrome c family protein|nr:cytochrome c [Pyrinomonadaceae bacterium]